jgi:hypothetical protein
VFLAAIKTVWALAGGVYRLLPPKVWAILGLVTVVIFYHLYTVHEAHKDGFTDGFAEANDQCTAREAAAKEKFDRQVKKIQEEQQQVITRTVIEYRDRVQIVKEKGDEIVKEVPVLVPRTVGVLPGGMRVIHDAAASGDLPSDPQRAADAAAPVDATTLAATVAANYETCRANAEELIALQSLVVSLERKAP